MRFTSIAAFALLAVAVPSPPAAAQEQTIPRADGAAIPVRLAGDWSAGACPPTLVLSHGLGGDERGLSFLLEAGRRAGYRVLAMAHQESGRPVLRRFFMTGRDEAMLRSPEIWRGRALDVEAAVAFATRACRPARMVLAGQSMGAATTMFEAGARGTVGWPRSGRFDAYIALSQHGVGWAFSSRGAWSGVNAPVLMITGTRDSGADGDWSTRLAAFDGLPAGRKRLAVIEGATHLNLGGLGNAAAQGIAGELAREFLVSVRQGTWTASAQAGKAGVVISDK
jgi:pimeloyl-ACP methyl ester carboxylesterase